jgi:hypothetical protein
LEVSEKQPKLPLSHSWQRDQHGEDEGRNVPNEAESFAEHLVESFDVRMHIRRERRGRSPICDVEVDAGQHRKEQEENRKESELCANHTPENVTSVEGAVPQIVNVEASDRTPEDQDEHKQSAESNQDATAGKPAS